MESVIPDDVLAHLEALEEAYRQAEDPEGFMTRQEIQDATGLGADAVRMRLHAAKKAGRLEVAQVYRENLAGVRHATTAYKITDAA